MQKITPFLWFNDQAEEAMNFYTSIFKNSKIVSHIKNSEGVSGGTFEIEGTEFIAFNGGPTYTFTPAVSLFVDCKDQKEVDELWEKLLEGGEESRCGWLTDKFGLSWQIIPKDLMELMADPDEEKSKRVMDAMLKMKKIIIKDLKEAHEGKAL